jgi:hypothetical protein
MKKNRLPDKSQLPILDLDQELYERNNVICAFHVILSGLIKNKGQRQEIISKVKPNYMGIPFYQYLFEIITNDLRKSDDVNITYIIKSIPEFEPKVYGTRPNKRS